jgi:pyruvate/2-oxoglutarate dehydrogenase complex dihydrolipoamide acyltransferase (E2) component
VGEKLHDLVGIQARIPGLQQIFWAWPYLRRILRERSHANGVDFLKGNPATVVLTNPGTLGVADCKAVLFFGQLLTCLRIMAIEEEAVLDGDRLRFRKVLPVGLDYDQRLCDAPQAARLLAEFRRNLEHPESLLPGSLAPGQLRNK